MSALQNSWEASDFRCPVCFNLFGVCDSADNCPVFVCSNHHTTCRNCMRTMQQSGSPACAECRDPLRAPCAPNRILIPFLERATLPCGACTYSKPLSIHAIHQHALECPQAMVQCPMPSSENTDEICGHRMRLAELWEHCLQTHASAPAAQVPCVDGTATVTGSLAPGASTSISYASTLDGSTQGRWALMLAREDGGLAIRVRRFTLEAETPVSNLRAAVETCDEYGMVVRLPGVLRANEAGGRDSGKRMLVPDALVRGLSGPAHPARVHVAVELCMGASPGA
jgi:hypothetical protein